MEIPFWNVDDFCGILSIYQVGFNALSYEVHMRCYCNGNEIVIFNFGTGIKGFSFIGSQIQRSVSEGRALVIDGGYNKNGPQRGSGGFENHFGGIDFSIHSPRIMNLHHDVPVGREVAGKPGRELIGFLPRYIHPN